MYSDNYNYFSVIISIQLVLSVCCVVPAAEWCPQKCRLYLTNNNAFIVLQKIPITAPYGAVVILYVNKAADMECQRRSPMSISSPLRNSVVAMVRHAADHVLVTTNKLSLLFIAECLLSVSC